MTGVQTCALPIFGLRLSLDVPCNRHQACYVVDMEQVLSLSVIRERKEALMRTIADAQSQIADLEVAERIVRRFGEAVGERRPSGGEMDDMLDKAGVAPSVGAIVAKSSASSTGAGLTAKALFTSVLRQSPEPWMTANEIQERAAAIKGQDVPMGTVSPTLSLMKNEGLIVRDGLKVALADRTQEIGNALFKELAGLPNENGAPEGAPEARLDANPA